MADGKAAVGMGESFRMDGHQQRKKGGRKGRREEEREGRTSGGRFIRMHGGMERHQLRHRGTMWPLPRARARQDGERWAWALQRAQREALEREATRGAEQARQQELIRDMKERLLELLR